MNISHRFVFGLRVAAALHILRRLPAGERCCCPQASPARRRPASNRSTISLKLMVLDSLFKLCPIFCCSNRRASAHNDPTAVMHWCRYERRPHSTPQTDAMHKSSVSEAVYAGWPTA